MIVGFYFGTQSISIHSTTRVETKTEQYTLLRWKEFQSTPPRGWRRSTSDIYVITVVISIHSTTRVETINLLKIRHHNHISIHSTTRVETTLSYMDTLPLRFQSTPPRGWRLLSPLVPRDREIFQSTPPRGWRLSNRSRSPPTHQFQSTPPRGWRPGMGGRTHEHRISIHSTTRVETAILHNNHYYSSTHFHKQIISHPLKSRPTIPAHSQIRSHCANFPVRISP